MVQSPGVIVTARPSEAWQFEGALASRAQAFAIQFMQHVPETLQRPFQVLVERCPAEHTGLGVGTQLALAVAKALDVGIRLPDLNSVELARRVGRGERSAVGVHGFDRGGLLVESGKLRDEDVAPMLAHVQLPEEWRVVLFTPPGSAGWSGGCERLAFASASPGDCEFLRQLAETVIVPAAHHGDCDDFGEAVHEFNRRAGEPFAHSQGGVYASPAIAELIADLRNRGIRGVGQSSWGPTVFAIVRDSDTALSLVLHFRNRMPVHVTRVASGHTLERR